MRYELKFDGGFFQIADFLRRVDNMVRTKGGEVDVNGRLMTVDAFTLSPVIDAQNPSPVPKLTADLSVTTYLTPPAQGTLAGATPGGPTGSTSVNATPASSTTVSPGVSPASSSAPTSTTAP
jgi:hypothetical protein